VLVAPAGAAYVNKGRLTVRPSFVHGMCIDVTSLVNALGVKYAMTTPGMGGDDHLCDERVPSVDHRRCPSVYATLHPFSW
jgi:hypothetical protein